MLDMLTVFYQFERVECKFQFSRQANNLANLGFRN